MLILTIGSQVVVDGKAHHVREIKAKRDGYGRVEGVSVRVVGHGVDVWLDGKVFEVN